MTDTRARQRILLVTRNLPPLIGGMERLNWHMAEELARTTDVRIVGPRGSATLAPADVTVAEVPLRPLWQFLLKAQWRAWRVARRWHPDIVLAGSGLTAPAALMAARTCGARAVAYVHGLDLAVRHPLYKAMWLPALRRMDRIIANSHPTQALAEQVGIRTTRIGVVYPGVDLPASVHDIAERPFFRERHGLGDRPLLLSVGRLSTRKGLREFVTHALPRLVAQYPDIMLLIVGDAPHDALGATAQTPASIRAAATAVGVVDHLRFLGVITDYVELGTVYRAADVHVFPVRHIPGDPEGFGMVAVEAAAHCLPTVAFATGGVTDAVAEGESGHLVPPNDYAALADAIIRTLSEGDSLRKRCQHFAQRFAWPNFGAQLSAILTGCHDGAS